MRYTTSHGRALYRATAGLFLLDHNGRLLLMRRSSKSPTSTGLFDVPGGHIEHHETALDAIVREVKEELGLHLDPAAVTPATALHHPHSDGNYPNARVDLYYTCTEWHGEPTICEPGKCDELQQRHPHTLAARDTNPAVAWAWENISKGVPFDTYTGPTGDRGHDLPPIAAPVARSTTPLA